MSAPFEEQLAAATGSSLHNPEAEISLLGDMLADNTLIDRVSDRLRPAHFGVPVHGAIFARMQDMALGRATVDAITLAPFFREDADWQRLYPILAAADLNAGPVARTKGYLDQVLLLATRRRLRAGMLDVAASAADLSIGQAELVANADEAVAALAVGQEDRRQAPVGTYAKAVIESFGKPIVGVRCGIIGSLDDKLGVLRPSHLIVVGGRPGMGKTSLVTSYSIGAAARGHGVLIFSLEMGADELTRRMLADMCFSPSSRVPYEDIRDGTVHSQHLSLVHDAQRKLDDMPIEISETPGLTIQKLVRETRLHKRRQAAAGQALELVVVDYLQLMPHSRKGMSPYEHASEVSRALKQLAKDEGIAVMAVAQLSRDLERRENKRPMPSDLRDSGQIEQDADSIVFVYREEEYLKQQEPADQHGSKYESWRTEMEAVRDRVEMIVAKRRHGPTGKALGWFFGANSAVRGNDFYSEAGRYG